MPSSSGTPRRSASGRACRRTGRAFGSLAISPDGKTIAAPLAGRGIVAWDLTTLSERPIDGPVPGDKAPASAGAGIAFAPDGSKLAGPAPDLTAPASILVHDLATGASVGFGPPGNPATHLAFTPDGRSLLAKGIEGQIQAYDVATRAERPIAANLSYLAGVAVSPDGATVASSGADRYLRLWSVADGSEQAKLKGHLRAILGVAFHPDGRHVATGDAGGSIFLWDVPSRRAVAQFSGHAGKVWAIAFRPDGREMATAGEDRRIRIWDVERALRAN